MSDDQSWASTDDTQPTDDGGESTPVDESSDSAPADPSTDSAATGDGGESTPSTEDQEKKGEPQLDLSQAQVGQPPEEALAFNDFETSWTEGVA